MLLAVPVLWAVNASRGLPCMQPQGLHVSASTYASDGGNLRSVRRRVRCANRIEEAFSAFNVGAVAAQRLVAEAAVSNDRQSEAPAAVAGRRVA